MMNDLIRDLVASVDPATLLATIVEEICVHIPAATGASICLSQRDGTLEVLAASGMATPLTGRAIRIEETFQAVTLQTGLSTTVDDARTDPRLTPSVRAVSARIGVLSCLSIPLRNGDEVIGTLSLVAQEASAFHSTDTRRISALSRFLGALITSNAVLARLLTDLIQPDESNLAAISAARFLAAVVLPESARLEKSRLAVRRLFEPENMYAVFQPIVSLATGEVVAFEGLSRFRVNEHGLRPDECFSLAHAVDDGVARELQALRMIVAESHAIPAHFGLNVNVSPGVIRDNEVQDCLSSLTRPLVVELTEHEPSPEALPEWIEPLRRLGIRIAVDDAGSGFAGLTTILRLRPDVIKLDRELIVGVDHDPVRRSLTAAVCGFAAETGASTVAEGIENDQQLDCMRRLGVCLGQGFALGHPMPVGEWERMHYRLERWHPHSA